MPSTATAVLNMSDIPDDLNSILQDISYSGTETTKPNFECSLDKSPYSNNAKHGSYKPMSWTIEVKLFLMSYVIVIIIQLTILFSL